MDLREEQREFGGLGPQLVLRKRARTARLRADALLPVVEIDPDRVTGLQIGRMLGRVELLRRPAARGQPELRLALDPKPADLHPADVGSSAVLLRTDVRRLECVDGRLQTTHHGG